MDDTIDFDLTRPLPAEDKQAWAKEDCKNIADLFAASVADTFDSQNGPILHLEFDDAKKFEKFAEYLRAHGALCVDLVQTKSGKAH
jgi:hypothetical protein